MAAQKKTIFSRPKKMAVAADEQVLADLYNEDFYSWANTQVKLLRKGEFSKLDIDNLIEEIESLGRSEKRALKSYLANLMMHLLKIEYQPEKHTKSWDLSVKNSKFEAKNQLKENPGLKSQLPKILQEAYFTARINAALETDLDEKTFPKNCPWDIDDLI